MLAVLFSIRTALSGMPPKVSMSAAPLGLSLSLLLAACGGNYTQQISEVTGKTRYLNPAVAQKKYQGLETATIDSRGILQIKMTEKLYAPEFEAPMVRKKRVDGKRANPVGTTLATALTAGIYPLFAPKEFFKETVGQQTSEQILSEEPDVKKAVLTGRHEWVSIPLKSGSIEIRGLGPAITHELMLDEKGVGELDISAAIFNQIQGSKRELELSVSCIGCRADVVDPDLPVSRISTFNVTDAWRLLATVRKSQDLVWAADLNLIGEPASKPVRAGRNRIATWKDITAETQRRAEKQLKRLSEMPSELQNAKAAISRSRPSPEVTLTRDEFESTAAFNERVRSTRASEEEKTRRYNQQVEQLNRKIREFQESAPRALPRSQILSIMGESLTDLVGDPEVKSVAYDADLQRFIVSVSGISQPDRAPVTFTMVSQSSVSPNDARALKQQLFKARPFLRFAVSEKSISPASASLLVENRVLDMRFVDSADLPPLETVKLEGGQANTLQTLRKAESSAISAQAFDLKEDPESRRLRERLESLRSDMRQKQETNSEKERLSEEIKRLEARLKKFDDGDFQDDLQDRIAKLPAVAGKGNTYAIIIGISHYAELPKVAFADRSASSFAELVRRQYGVTPDHMVTLINEEATGVRLMARLRSMNARLTKNDRLIFYYAGHGAPSSDGQNTLLVPQDASVNALDDVQFRLQDIYKTLVKNEAAQILVVLDTCFSGRTDNNELIYRDVAPIMVVPTEGISPPPNRRLTVLAAGGPADFANALRARGHRLFSYHLLRVMLKDGGISPANFSAVSEAVVRDASVLGPVYRQEPVWMGSKSSLAP